MLEHARTGHLPLFGHVPDQHCGDVALLGEPDQCPGDLTDLAHATDRTVHLRCADRLDRVDDQQRRLYGVDMADNRPEIGLCCKVDVRVQCTDAFPAQPHLRCGLFPRDHECPCI